MSTIFPLPNCPLELYPQQYKVASSNIAQECRCPTEIDNAERPIGISTSSAIILLSLVPSPSWPFALSPQQITFPSSKTEQVWWNPDSIIDGIWFSERGTGFGRLKLS